jgi:drug/metabolite transporter (DMT)-like permease
MVAGVGLALASAVAFGAATPLVQRFGHGVGPFVTAALLYGGAALFSALSWRTRVERPLLARDLPRVGTVALLGAVVGPVALAWGLQRTSGVTASLLLNLEALFTVVLARAVWAEPIGARVGVALVATTAGGLLLVSTGSALSAEARWGTLAVLGATLAWAADNTVGRPLADRDPARVILAKSVLGAAASGILARAFGEARPTWFAALSLAGCGAVGYGVSLELYLLAQRATGAARTGSIFAVAPFVGALVAGAMGQRAAGVSTAVAGALCAVGVLLHVTETHGHAHTHEAIDHTHPHRHDDHHHVHSHAEAVEEHTHPHHHERATHSHPHGLDEDHRHRH